MQPRVKDPCPTLLPRSCPRESCCTNVLRVDLGPEVSVWDTEVVITVGTLISQVQA